ncbi:tetratricopeptide (TPR) repeat protein [Roseateles asaccharophilus]|uniref:tetratricopeptide repeat protein n=1 Tax=Roseateles asaccharophilus TaxID=582607 RepID=UPI003834C428
MTQDRTSSSGGDSLDEILPLLHARAFSQALPRLEVLARVEPARADVRFNLGLALSETRQIPEAVIQLRKAIELDPECDPALVALGVAYIRLKRFADAREVLVRATNQAPSSGLAFQNLVAACMYLRDHKAAVAAARQAALLLPHTDTLDYLLADAIMSWALDDAFDGAASERESLLSEASDLFKAVLENPASRHAQAAEEGLTRISAHVLRRGASFLGGFRPDVLEYITGALKLFKEVGETKRNLIVAEVVKICAEGVNINNPDRKHALSTIAGDYTGLHLVSIMYAGMQQIDPSQFVGVDFSEEYRLAKARVDGAI